MSKSHSVGAQNVNRIEKQKWKPDEFGCREGLVLQKTVYCEKLKYTPAVRSNRREDFSSKLHLCKLCVTLRSRVLLGVYPY